MKKVITTMLVAAMVLSMAVPTSAATITRKKSTGTSASTTKVSGDYSLKMVDKTLQFIRGGKVVSSIETKDGKITLRKSSAGGISVVFTDANGKRRNITLGKQDSVSLSGTFTQVSVDKALGSSFEVEMEKGSKVTNFYAKGAAKVTLNGSVTTLNVTSSNGNVDVNGTVTRAYAVNKKAISGMASGKITQTSTGTSASGSVNTSTGSSSSSNTTVNSGSGSGSSSSGGSSGIIINGGGSNNGGNSTSKRNPKLTASSTAIPTYDEGTVLNTISLTQFGLKAMYGNTEVAGTFSWNNPTSKVAKGTYTYRINFTPKDTKTYNSATINVKIEGKEVVATQTLAEAKKAIEDRLAALSVDNTVTKETIQALADNEIKSGSGIKAVADVTVVKATETTEGTIKGTITLTKGTETATVTVDLKIAKLSALDAAKAEVEAVLNGFTATKDTTKADVEAALDAIDKKYTSVTITVEKFDHDEANKTFNTEVKLVENGVEKTVTKALTYTNGGEEGEAKAPTFINNLDEKQEEIQLDTAKPVTFTVKASVDGTTEEGVTYQWYKTSAMTADDLAARIPLGTGNSYTLSTSDLSENYYNYFVIATNTVDGKSESTVSNLKMIKVTLPEGSAAAPIVEATTTQNSYRLGANAADLVADVKNPGDMVVPTYEWYKSDSQDSAGEKVATTQNYKPATNTAGVAYYYVKVTNTDKDAKGLKSVTTTSNRVKVTVTAYGTVTATPVVTDGTTSAIDVKFDPALPVDTMKALTKDDFALKTEDATAHKDECTVAISDVRGLTTSQDTIRVYITGVDEDQEKVELTFKKDITDTGITITDKVMEHITLVKKATPVKDARVTGIEAVVRKSAMNKDLDTQEIKLTFDQELTTVPTSLEFTYGTGATPSTLTIAQANMQFDGTNKKVVIATVIAGNEPTGTAAKETLTLIKVGATEIETADQQKVDYIRDVTDPKIVSATLGTDDQSIALQFDEPLDTTAAPTGFTVKVGATADAGATVTFAPNDDTSIIVKLSTAKPADTVTVEYDPTTGNVTDASVKKNAMKEATKTVAPTTVEKLAIDTVKIDDPTALAPKVTVAMNDKITLDASVTPTAVDPTLFNVVGNVTGKKYVVSKIEAKNVASFQRALRATTAPTYNAFEIVLSAALDSKDTGVKVTINTSSSVADKIESVSKPGASMGEADTTPVPTPEVKAATVTYGTQTAITEGAVGAADVELYAAPTVANFTKDATVSYSMVDKTTNAVPTQFKIDQATGAISAIASQNLTAGKTVVIVTAEDDATPAKTASVEVTITVGSNTPAGTTATDELAKIKDTDLATLPAGTANTQAGVEAALKAIAESKIDGTAYEVKIVTTSYNTTSKEWAGKFTVTSKTEPTTDTATDGADRTITVTISTTPDTTAPEVKAGVVENSDPDKLVLTVSETVTGTPIATDFTVTTGGNGNVVTAASVSGTTITLTLTTPVKTKEAVTVAYTAGSNKIEDASGNAMADFAAGKVTVTNNVQATVIDASGTVTVTGAKNAITTADDPTDLVKVTVAGGVGLDVGNATVDLVDGTSGNTVSTLTAGDEVKYKITIAPSTGYKIPDVVTGFTVPSGYTVTKDGNNLVLTTTNAIAVTQAEATGALTVTVPATITADQTAQAVKDGISVSGGTGLATDAATIKFLKDGSQEVSTFAQGDNITIEITITPATGYEVPANATGITAQDYTVTKDNSGNLVLTADTAITVGAAQQG